LSLVGAEAQQAPLFWDDFEVQDFSAWNNVDLSNIDAVSGGAGVVTSERAHSGRFSFRATLPAPGGKAKLSHAIPPQQNLYYSFFFFVDTGWTQGHGVYLAAVEHGASLILRSDGGCLSLQDRTGARGSHCITKGVWHSLEIHSRAGIGDGLIEVWLDGEADLAAHDLKLDTPFDRIYLGLEGGDGKQSGSIYFDDVVLAASRIGAPSAWVTIRHPNTLGRISLPVDVVFYGFERSDKVVAQLDGKDIYTRADPGAGWVRFAVDLSGVPPGVHELTVRLQGSGGMTKAASRSVLHQFLVEGNTPRITIDENNGLRWNGRAYFPISPFDFMMDPESGPYRTHHAINTYGWADCTLSPDYSAYAFDACARRLDLPIIGPAGLWPGGGKGLIAAVQPAALDEIARYVKKARDNPHLAMWSWQDEPDLGPMPGHVPVERMKELIQVTHANDGNHPVITNLAGYPYNIVDDRHRGWYFPIVPADDDLPTDVYSFDMYPLIYQKQGYTVSQLVQHFDRVQRYTYGMVPLMAFIEAGKCVQPRCAGIGPSGAQVYMEAWLAVIHGVKGVFWWGPRGWTDEDESHWKAVAQFKKDIDQLKGVILSPADRSVTTDRSAPHTRVDAAAREDSSCVYVFAARLTESGNNDPDLVTHLTVSGVKNGVARVPNEGRTVPVRDGVIEDVFAPAAVHLYCIPKAR
jgi:hypothetical protein